MNHFLISNNIHWVFGEVRNHLTSALLVWWGGVRPVDPWDSFISALLMIFTISILAILGGVSLIRLWASVY